MQQRAQFWSFLVGFAILAQWFHVLFFGKRREKLWRFKVSFFRFYTRMFAYYSIIADKRPPISGRSMPLSEISKPPERKPPKPVGYCMNCGAELRPEDKYCRKCSQKVSQTP